MSFDRSNPVTELGQVDLSELLRLAERAAGPIPYSTDSAFFQSELGNVMSPDSGATATFSGFKASCSPGTQTCPNAAATDVTLDSGFIDTDGYIATPGDAFVTLPFDGRYLFGATFAGLVAVNLAAVGRLYGLIDQASNTPGTQTLVLPAGVTTSDTLAAQVTHLLAGAAGDQIAFTVVNRSGQAFTLSSGAGLSDQIISIFWGVFLGSP